MIDSHCHLAGAEFESDLLSVTERAGAAGIQGALVILGAGDTEEARRARRVAELWPAVQFAVGIHPHHASEHAADVDAAIEQLDRELTACGAVAVGEIGLDYHYDFSSPDAQQELFQRQLGLARDRRLPVVIHTREAEEDTFDILRRHGRGLRVVFHCFTGTLDMAQRALDDGAWVSFAGIVTFPKADALRAVASSVRADRLLAETDAPYLAPVPHRGRRNEPAFVRQVVEALAAARGETVTATAERTVENYRTVFGGAA